MMAVDRLAALPNRAQQGVALLQQMPVAGQFARVVMINL
jgi:hypothetical protein